jgi:hypothetical protein
MAVGLWSLVTLINIKVIRDYIRDKISNTK